MDISTDIRHELVPMNGEELREFIAKLIPLLNPDDWWFLGATLQHAGKNCVEDLRLCCHWGSAEPKRFVFREFEMIFKPGKLRFYSALLSGKSPKIIRVEEENLLPVLEIVKYFLRNEYEVASLRARGDYEKYAYDSPGILLEVSSPGFGSCEPMVEIASRSLTTEASPPATEKIIHLLRSMGLMRS